MKFNMNDKFSAVLTEAGAAAYNNYHAPYNTKKAGDTVTTELWDLFYVFGQSMYVGNPLLPFEKNEIVAEDAGINFNKDTDIAIVWSIDDVQTLDDTLTDSEAMQVLQYVEDNHDCNDGITWDTLESATAWLYKDGGSKNKQSKTIQEAIS